MALSLSPFRGDSVAFRLEDAVEEYISIPPAAEELMSTPPIDCEPTTFNWSDRLVVGIYSFHLSLLFLLDQVPSFGELFPAIRGINALFFVFFPSVLPIVLIAQNALSVNIAKCIIFILLHFVLVYLLIKNHLMSF